MLGEIRSIAIGSFDGIHLGHRELIKEVDLVVIIERNSGYLTPGFKRAYFIQKACAFYLFDKIKSLSPKEFVELLERDFPVLERIVVGYDFHFGTKKSGTAESLRTLFAGEVTIIDEVKMDGISVHSKTIKSLIKEGNITLANQLLGREYMIEGVVIKGQGIGAKELVPTLNLKVEEYLLPKEGVYATYTHVNGEWFPSVSFLGHRKSTDDIYAIETHILNQDIEEAQGSVSLKFHSRMRGNKKFNDLSVLREAIEQDIAVAKLLLTK